MVYRRIHTRHTCGSCTRALLSTAPTSSPQNSHRNHAFFISGNTYDTRTTIARSITNLFISGGPKSRTHRLSY
jgi:hypothetical protein